MKIKHFRPTATIITGILLIVCLMASSCATQKKRYKGYAPCPCENNH
ncbi:MAG: hypothetical protein J6U04_01645 [Salinivirgaceae bacterium]|nr:hypothetical protein [Salinivirgaceae bacterium]